MKVNGYNITDFVVTTYADMFHRKAVLAYTSDGEWNFEHNGIKYTVLVEVEN